MNRKSLDLWQKKEYTFMKPGLERTSELLLRLGSPQNSFKSIIVAGTNGKGSTAKMIADILQNSGYKTGLYISPHLVKLNERISFNGKEITNDSLEKEIKVVAKAAKNLDVTFFEFITAVAFSYFKNKKVDIAVLEVGLGGRYDSVNVVDNVLASVITEIGLDHCHVLGNTISAIAKEKSGIIKEGVPVITAATLKEAKTVIKKTAKAKHSKYLEFGKEFISAVSGSSYKFKQANRSFKYNLSLNGKYQLRNSAVAIATCLNIDDDKYNVFDKTIQSTLKNVVWHGRLEKRDLMLGSKKLHLIIDGAHNPQAVKALVKSLKQGNGYAKHNLIFGVLKDKDYKNIIAEFSEIAGSVTIVPINTSRSLDTVTCKKEWLKYLSSENVKATNSVKKALQSMKDGERAVICGSLYLAGEVLKIINI